MPPPPPPSSFAPLPLERKLDRPWNGPPYLSMPSVLVSSSNLDPAVPKPFLQSTIASFARRDAQISPRECNEPILTLASSQVNKHRLLREERNGELEGSLLGIQVAYAFEDDFV